MATQTQTLTISEEDQGEIYDGDWDTDIDDFATIPDDLDIIDSAWEGWPAIRGPHAEDDFASTRSRRKTGRSPVRI